MYLFYNIIFTGLFILSFPYFFLRSIIGGHGVKERFGFLGSKLSLIAGKKNLVWIHASSLGEVKLIPVLMDALRQSRPELNFIVSTTTKTGQREAQRLLKGKAAFTFYQPLDLPGVTNRVMKLLKPAALLLVETEFWPNLIRSAKKFGVQIGLVNGRISSRSYKRYVLIRPLCREVLSLVDFFAVQTEKDLSRLNDLGAQVNKMRIVGSLKFDLKFQVAALPNRRDRKSLGIASDQRVLVAGSTRPGEEEIVLQVFRRLQSRNRLTLILAPRHLDRIGELELLLQQGNFRYGRKSQLPANGDKNIEVLLLDTMGELAEIYSVADIAFVGGSLVPLGGHNPLEPAVYGSPVLFGPYMEHSQAAAELLIESGLGFKVRNQEEFFKKSQEILSNGLDTPRLFSNFQAALRQKSGAAQKTAELFTLAFRHPPG